jgi:hypothetical protein
MLLSGRDRGFSQGEIGGFSQGEVLASIEERTNRRTRIL